MAYPFGGHPRLRDYLAFLETLGCTWKAAVRLTKAGRSYEELVITGPGGQHYLIVNPDHDERLLPHIIGNIQRRLGVKTPYAAAPDVSDEPKE